MERELEDYKKNVVAAGMKRFGVRPAGLVTVNLREVLKTDFFNYELMETIQFLVTSYNLHRVNVSVHNWIDSIKEINHGRFGSVYDVNDDVFALKISMEINSNSVVENLIGMKYMNSLRRIIPHFIYFFGTFVCSQPVGRDFCSPDGDQNRYTVMERIPGGRTLHSVIKSRTPSEIFSLAYQVFSAMAVANKAFGFTHYDLHAGNVLIRPLTEPTWVPIGEGKYIRTKEIPTVIDFGYSRVTSSVTGRTLGGQARHLSRSFPAYDIMVFFTDIAKSSRDDVVVSRVTSLIEAMYKEMRLDFPGFDKAKRVFDLAQKIPTSVSITYEWLINYLEGAFEFDTTTNPESPLDCGSCLSPEEGRKSFSASEVSNLYELAAAQDNLSAEEFDQVYEGVKGRVSGWVKEAWESLKSKKESIRPVGSVRPNKSKYTELIRWIEESIEYYHEVGRFDTCLAELNQYSKIPGITRVGTWIKTNLKEYEELKDYMDDQIDWAESRIKERKRKEESADIQDRSGLHYWEELFGSKLKTVWRKSIQNSPEPE